MPSTPFKITKFGIVGKLTGSVEGTASCAISASYVSGAVLSPTVQHLVEITSASYSAIVHPDPNTLYVITDVSGGAETASYAETASVAETSSYSLIASGGVVTEEEMDEIFSYTRDSAVLTQDLNHDNSIRITLAN